MAFVWFMLCPYKDLYNACSRFVHGLNGLNLVWSEFTSDKYGLHNVWFRFVHGFHKVHIGAQKMHLYLPGA